MEGLAVGACSRKPEGAGFFDRESADSQVRKCQISDGQFWK